MVSSVELHQMGLTLNDQGYGWNHAILSALLDHVIQSYSVDMDRLHVAGFSMGKLSKMSRPFPLSHSILTSQADMAHGTSASPLPSALRH